MINIIYRRSLKKNTYYTQKPLCINPDMGFKKNTLVIMILTEKIINYYTKI